MAFAHAQLVPSGSREIRVGSDAWAYGEPYDWCCIAKPMGEKTVELSLVTTPPSRCQAWAVVRLLRSLGYREILVRRIVDGHERVVRHVLAYTDCDVISRRGPDLCQPGNMGIRSPRSESPLAYRRSQ